jgi:hypothetical protein
MKYQNLTDTGLARKQTHWMKRHAEATERMGKAQTEGFRNYWYQATVEATAELEKINAVHQLRERC